MQEAMIAKSVVSNIQIAPLPTNFDPHLVKQVLLEHPGQNMLPV